MLADALSWSKRFAVLPLTPRGKKPHSSLVSHGLKDATCDPAIVTAWWRAAPRANIGLALPSGIFVVDLDGEEAGRDWTNLCGRHGEPPPTLAVTTGRGKHLYFRSSVEVKNSAGRIGAGIDTRGYGGYTIAPPSIHPSGAIYSLDKRCTEIAVAPQWLVDMARPEEKAPLLQQHYRRLDMPLRGLSGVIAAVAAARDGERNSLAFWGACRARDLVNFGIIDEGLAEQLLIEAAASAGLPYPEARATVRSGLRQAARHG